MENTFEPTQQSNSESINIFSEVIKALKILCIRRETIISVSQSQPAFRYGLVFMFLPNIVLFILILLSRVSVGFSGLLVSLAQTFLIIGLSFLIARFLFRGKGTLGGYFRPAAYSFIFIALTPLIVLIYAPLPTVAGLLAILTIVLGLWNIVVLAKVLQYTQNIGIIKSLASVLVTLLILSWGLSVQDISQQDISQQDISQLSQTELGEGQNGQSETSLSPDRQGLSGEEDETPVQEFGSELVPRPEPQAQTGAFETEPTLTEAAQQTVMGGMSTHMMQQISHGIWSGNFYNPMIP